MQLFVMNRLVLRKLFVLFLLVGFVPSTSPGLFSLLFRDMLASAEDMHADSMSAHHCACEASGNECKCGASCCGLSEQQSDGAVCIQEKPDRAAQPVEPYVVAGLDRYFLYLSKESSLSANSTLNFLQIPFSTPLSWISSPDPPPPRV